MLFGQSRNHARVAIALATLMLYLQSCGLAQPGSEKAALAILAFVGDNPITLADVNFQLGRFAAEGESLPDLPPAVLNSTVQLIALQRQALQSLRDQKLAVGSKDVSAWLEANPPASGDPTLKPTAQQIVKAVCDQAALQPLAYIDFIAFRLSWQNYVRQHLTEANVAKHFKRQRARFDGTEFDVEMVSIAAPAGASAARDAATKRLEPLSATLAEDGSSESWDQTLVELKTQPGIELTPRRTIRGSGDIDPILVDALLELASGSSSPPVHNATGVHVMRLFEKRAGDRSMNDARDEIRAHMLLYLLQFIASQSADKLPVKSNSPQH